MTHTNVTALLLDQKHTQAMHPKLNVENIIIVRSGNSATLQANRGMRNGLAAQAQ